MRPNFVFIMTDTQSADFIGCYGRPELQTPHLDALAAEGVRFDRAYTTCPVCSPARSAIFTGLMPSKAGPMMNNLALFQDVRHMGQRFADAGYATAYTGKWHLDGHDYFGDGVCPPGWDERYWYDGKRYLDDLDAEAATDGRDLVDLWRRGLGSVAKLEEHGITAEFTWAHRVSDRAIAFLEERPTDRPFVLVASYDEPHHPATCPADYARLFIQFDFDLGPSATDDLTDKPEHHRAWAAKCGETPADGKVRKPLFFGCNSFVDTEIGRVLDAAQRVPNTWIIFTSDHGEMLGAHGITSKGPAMYEQITRVPLIVRPPHPITGRGDATPVSHVDLLPTMLDLAGLDVPPIMDGQSFADRLRPNAAPTEDRAIIMEFHRHSLPHDSYGGFIPIRCIVRGRWKLVINLHDVDELYDLNADPGETRNRIDDQILSAVRDELLDILLARMNAVRDPMRGPCWERRRWRERRALGFSGDYRMKPADGYSELPRVYATGRPEEQKR